MFWPVAIGAFVPDGPIKRFWTARQVTSVGQAMINKPNSNRTGFLHDILGRLLGQFAADTRAGVVILVAATLPVVLLMVGVTIDYGMLSVRKANLQGAADAAALASARELQLANTGKATVEAVAKRVAMSNLTGDTTGVTIATKVSSDPAAVTVQITQSPGLVFTGKIAKVADFDITVDATARIAGGTTICVLTLEPSRNAIWLQDDAVITGNKCGVFSNSTGSKAIKAKGDAVLHSELTCSGGGFSGKKASFKPIPLTDCPVVDDPLASRAPPYVGACDYKNFEVDDVGGTKLSPGVYCGGLTIKNGSEVKLLPGIYVIKDGPLKISGKSRLYGENVGFYLTGTKATFEMASSTSIRLTPPLDGPMAGILFFEDRISPLGQVHKINSNDASLLLGTFYLPRGVLKIDAKRKIAHESAYTVFITQQLKLYAGPNLVLNTDFDGTDIPVPPEIIGAADIKTDVVLVD